MNLCWYMALGEAWWGFPDKLAAEPVSDQRLGNLEMFTGVKHTGASLPDTVRESTCVWVALFAVEAGIWEAQLL